MGSTFERITVLTFAFEPDGRDGAVGFLGRLLHRDPSYVFDPTGKQCVPGASFAAREPS